MLRLTVAVHLLYLLSGPALGAQARISAGPSSHHALIMLGSTAEDRMRLGHLIGDRSTDGFLIRSPSALSGFDTQRRAEQSEDARGLYWATLAPELHTVWNSDLPYSLNEGALWAGRGLSTRLTVGGWLRFRGATLVLAPQIVHERNRDFQTFAFPGPGAETRHALSSPFHFPPGSMDLPQRFGYEPRSFVDAGQSSLTVHRGSVAFGVATENLWWGPGIRNALLMSSHAPGIPHIFLGTARPVETRLGALEARWMVGRLTESGYFDFDPTNDHRSLSGLVLVLSPSFDRSLSVGFARTVYAPSGSIPLSAAFDAFRSVGRPSQVPGDTLIAPSPDQIFSLFARWAFPEAGFEAYGEWGRFEQPAGIRDLLEVPNHSRGYTVGLQYARPLTSLSAALRFQVEVTNLEPSTSYRVRPFGEWYASRAVPQGYTHRGRVLGASIGPSGSSQWLATDIFGEAWTVGGFVGRIRWENQARFTYTPEFRRSDLSLLTGLRGSRELGPLTIAAQYTRTARLNYLFQSEPITPVDDRGVDIVNHTVTFTVSTGSLSAMGGLFRETTPSTPRP